MFSGNQSSKYSKTAEYDSFEIRPDRCEFGLRRKKNGINVLPLNIPFSVLKSINQVTSLKVFSGNQSSKYSKTAGHDLFEILPETSLLGPPDTFICFSTRSPGKEFKRSVCKNYTSEYSSGTGEIQAQTVESRAVLGLLRKGITVKYHADSPYERGCVIFFFQM